MARLLRIERAMGRRRVIPKGPRLIDLDILLYADAVVAYHRPPDPASANR